MKTSERAMAGIGGTAMEVNPHDRDHLRELWRTAAEKHIAADDEYQRAKEGLKIFLDELIGELLAATPEMTLGTAERLARTSDAHKEEMGQVHHLRRKAADLKLVAADADRRYWESVSQEASARAEMKLTGYAR